MGPRPKSRGCRSRRGPRRSGDAKVSSPSTSSSSSRRPPRASAASQLEEAAALAACGDTTTALALTNSALAGADGDTATVQEAGGVQLLELGQLEPARACLLRAAELAPDTGHVKFVYLAQLHEGGEALQFLDRGIAVLQAAVAAGAGQESSDDLSAAWCARCELFTTDLCDEADAEANCEAALASALRLRPGGAEALQLRAGLRLLRDRRQEARDDLRASLDAWLRPLRDGRVADVDDCGLTFQQRLRAAELLLELEEIDACLDVLDLLVEEDDELPQVWLLFGLAYQRQGRQQAPAARFHLRRARDLLAAASADDEQLQAVDQLLLQLPPEEDAAEDAGEDAEEDAGASLA